MNDGVDGLAWVEKGELRVRDPASPSGKQASVVPCPGVELYVGGQRILREHRVLQSSVVTVRLGGKEPVKRVVPSVSKDRLTANVKVILEPGYTVRLPDQGPANRLVLRANKEPLIPTVEPEEVITALNVAGVIYGIDEQACKVACERPGESITVAHGLAATEGKAGNILFLVELKNVVELPLDRDRVDFRDAVRIPHVRAGQRIAVKQNPVEGIPGRGVTGDVLPCHRVYDPPFVAGEGVHMVTEGEQQYAVASRPGLPRFDKASGSISVETTYRHRGDVDLSSGNIRFVGNLVVDGDVKEDMRVWCDGDQRVGGQVTGASLRALGAVRIRGNLFKSSVEAGLDPLAVKEIRENLQRIEEIADEVRAVETGLRKRLAEAIGDEGAQNVELSSLKTVGAALQKRYADVLKEIVVKLRRIGEELPFDGIAWRLGKMVEHLETGWATFDRLYEAGLLAEDLRTGVIDGVGQGESDVILPYAQNSTVKATRDIIVEGQGAFYTTLVAGRSIKIGGNPGVMRGGEAWAAHSIEVNEAGGVGSVATTLKVGPGGHVAVRLLHPDTVISVGNMHFTAADTLRSVKASVKGGELVIAHAGGILPLTSP